MGYYNNDYLQHYGVLGMKWGVRRFQDKNGRLTKAGKKRYSDDKYTKKQSREDKHTKKQSREDKLYSDYKALGYSDKRARSTAKGRVKTERALIAIGGLTVAAAAAYAIYKYREINVDRIIAPDRVMQTVHKGDISDRIAPGSPFYASYTKVDNTIYSSRVFSHFTDDSNITRFYTKDGIKAASPKTGRKALSELIDKDPEVKKYIQDVCNIKDIKKTKMSKIYDKFNYSLVLRTDLSESPIDHDKIHNKFYNELKKKGYGAVIDMEDSKIEGFTFNPVIVFDDQIKHVISTTKATPKDLGTGKMLKGLVYSGAISKLHNPKEYAAIGTAYLSAVGIQARKSAQTNAMAEFARQYRKQHPNTKLTTRQIAVAYEKASKSNKK